MLRSKLVNSTSTHANAQTIQPRTLSLSWPGLLYNDGPASSKVAPVTQRHVIAIAIVEAAYM